MATAAARGRVSWSTDSARAQQSQLGKGNEIAHLMSKMPCQMPRRPVIENHMQSMSMSDFTSCGRDHEL